MREITVEESKKIILDILVDVTRFCDEQGLKYFITYGTLIGAVRHKGFIPWDDDIDIHMPRKDYNKLVEMFNEKNKDGKLKLISPKDEKAIVPFVKVIDTRTIKVEFGHKKDQNPLGCDIDVFPIDGMPSDYNEYVKWYKKLKKLYNAHLYGISKYDGRFIDRLKLLVHKVLCGFKSPKKSLIKAEKLHALYPYDSCDYVGCVESAFNGIGNRAKKEWYSDTVELEFEGLKFKAACGYDLILRNIYGDYMQLPPEEKRVTHHLNKVYIKED